MNSLDYEYNEKKSRESITENIDENYFVEAGAGSGKTTALVDRMVKMIEKGRNIEHISAITFTKAAANEFYERFQKKLIEKSLLEDENKQKYLDALQNIDLAFMGTIDSFCNKIMSEHPSEGLIPSDAKVIDDEKAKELYTREYNNIQNGLYNDEKLEYKAKLLVRYDNYAKDSFVSVLNEILNHRDCKIEIPSVTIENIDEKFKDEIKTIRKIVNVLYKHLEFITSTNEDKADKLKNAIFNYKYIFEDNWDTNFTKIERAYKETFFKGLKKDKDENFASDFRLYYSKEVEEALKEGIDYFVLHQGKSAWYDIDYDKFSFAIKYIEKLKYFVTLDFVCNAKDKILTVLRKEGYLTFSDYLIYLRDTLRKDASGDGKLIKHIYERHKYYLIDEFQDTDPIQAEIFFYLAAKNIKPDWRDCIPHKGSLFIVGDPKQSIYRFKNADVTSYLKIEEIFKRPEIGEVLNLYSNFRSTEEIRNWFNDTFRQLLPSKTDNQAEFVDIPIDNDEIYKGEFTGVYKYDVASRPKTNEEKDESKVCNIILKIINNDNYKIIEKFKDENKKSYTVARKIAFKDIMLITPGKSSLTNYTKAFREVGIPYYVEGNIKFKESKAFELFVDYYGAVINFDDNRYLYKVLKSNIYNIKEKDIAEANKNGLRFNVLTETKDIKLSKDLKKSLDELRKYASISKEICPSSLFTKIIEEIKAFKIAGIKNMEYVYFALELLKAKETNKEIITHIDAFNFFKNLLSSDNDQERCPSLQTNNNQVHLANLHKVKGLEAPVVILAHPNSKDREPSFRIVRGENGNIGYLFNVKKRVGDGSIKIINTDLYDVPFKEDEIESSNAESLRLQYVAATRAKNVLIIANQMKKDGPSESNPWYELLDSSRNLNDIELKLAKEVAIENPLKIINYDKYEDAKNILIENADSLKELSYEQKNPSKVINTNTSEDLEISEKQQKYLNESTKDTLATKTGTMVHRLLELIVISDNKIAKKDLIDTIVEENIDNSFINKKQYFIDILENVYETINNGGFLQKGKVEQNILPIILSADEVYSEVPFTYEEDNIIWNGIIDLIYVKDNKYHIIDWKTNKDDNDLDNHYKDQLDAYKKAVKQTLNIDVEDAYIYHIDLQKEIN